MSRPEIVLLLQPWSTAMSQTRKNTIAPDARILVHIKKLLICSVFHSGIDRERTAITAESDGTRARGIRLRRSSAIFAIDLTG